MTKQRGRANFIALCLAPAMILMIIFLFIPTINVFRMSLYKWGGYTSKKTFVGFANFKNLFSNAKFFQSFQNTILLIVIVTIFTFVFALVFAAILTRENIIGQNFFRIIFYIPNILSVVVISAIFSAIYSPEQGLLNTFLSLFHNMKDKPILWLGNQRLVIYSIALAMIWQAIGYYMVMYMASMANIPLSVYESATLEGAGKVHQFFNITIPMIWINIRTTLTFFVISTINMSFLFVKVMTSGGPDGASNVFLSYMYQEAYTNSSYGYGMAIGASVFVFSFLFAGILNFVTKREPLEY